jgi:putative oxidoreductase
MSYQNVKTNPLIFDIIIFIVRLFVGFAMLSHGFPKLQTLIEGGNIEFFDFFGLGSKVTLVLTVFAEFVCSIFLVLGLFTRFAAGFLIITMVIAAFVVLGTEAFDKKELSLLYLAIYAIITTFGAGAISIDYLIEKRRRASEW